MDDYSGGLDADLQLVVDELLLCLLDGLAEAGLRLADQLKSLLQDLGDVLLGLLHEDAAHQFPHAHAVFHLPDRVEHQVVLPSLLFQLGQFLDLRSVLALQLVVNLQADRLALLHIIINLTSCCTF
jgi:hypothetical protein